MCTHSTVHSQGILIYIYTYLHILSHILFDISSGILARSRQVDINSRDPHLGWGKRIVWLDFDATVMEAQPGYVIYMMIYDHSWLLVLIYIYVYILWSMTTGHHAIYQMIYDDLWPHYMIFTRNDIWWYIPDIWFHMFLQVFSTKGWWFTMACMLTVPPSNCRQIATKDWTRVIKPEFFPILQGWPHSKPKWLKHPKRLYNGGIRASYGMRWSIGMRYPYR